MRLEERHVKWCLMKNCDFGAKTVVLESVNEHILHWPMPHGKVSFGSEQFCSMALSHVALASGNYCVSDIRILALCPISGCNDSRKRQEMRLMHSLGTLHPSGLNERLTFI